VKVSTLIKQLQKYPQDAEIGTFSSERFDFCFTPIVEHYIEEGVETHEEFRRPGVRRWKDWVILVGQHQTWHPQAHRIHANKSLASRESKETK